MQNRTREQNVDVPDRQFQEDTLKVNMDTTEGIVNVVQLTSKETVQNRTR